MQDISHCAFIKIDGLRKSTAAHLHAKRMFIH